MRFTSAVAVGCTIVGLELSFTPEANAAPVDRLIVDAGACARTISGFACAPSTVPLRSLGGLTMDTASIDKNESGVNASVSHADSKAAFDEAAMTFHGVARASASSPADIIGGYGDGAANFVIDVQDHFTTFFTARNAVVTWNAPLVVGFIGGENVTGHNNSYWNSAFSISFQLSTSPLFTSGISDFLQVTESSREGQRSVEVLGEALRVLPFTTLFLDIRVGGGAGATVSNHRDGFGSEAAGVDSFSDYFDTVFWAGLSFVDGDTGLPLDYTFSSNSGIRWDLPSPLLAVSPAVPEPSTTVLLAAGGGALLMRGVRRRGHLAKTAKST